MIGIEFLNPSMARIAVCIPHSYQTLHKPFTLSLLGVVRSFDLWNDRDAEGDIDHELNVFMQNEGPIDQMREILVLTAQAWGADFILWLDADMTFPPNLIERMLNHFKDNWDLEAVTGLYTWKKPPFLPHVYTRLNKDTGKFAVAGVFPLNKPFKVEAAGYGCIMVRASNYPDNMRPWFLVEKTGDSISYGEDLYYFKKFHPINMICDPTISCLHYTEMACNIQSYLDYNGGKVLEDGNIDPDSLDLDKIANEHITNNLTIDK